MNANNNYRNILSDCSISAAKMSRNMLRDSPNAAMDKTLLNKYMELPQPDDKIQAEYIWIDGTGQGIRSKTRTINTIPSKPTGMYTHSRHC